MLHVTPWVQVLMISQLRRGMVVTVTLDLGCLFEAIWGDETSDDITFQMTSVLGGWREGIASGNIEYG